jgi:glycosyltransferase involved in cell wall biosynthesis
VVEVEAHPDKPGDYQFLKGAEILRWTEGCELASRYALRPNGKAFPSRRLALGTRNRPGLRSNAVSGVSHHISVCVCTFKRPESLRRLLSELSRQETGGLFTYSVVVADNDYRQSADSIVAGFAGAGGASVLYCVEPRQNIARARNKALENASGDFIAFIDDDEFPSPRWLLTLFNTCNEYGVDGVLGPVKPFFEQTPPAWVLKSKLYDRPSYRTGFVIDWRKGRTGNVLLREEVFDSGVQAFRPEFLTGEDQDFFRRMIDKGHVFVWCDEAVAYEVVPPVRWNRKFMLRRALLRGAVWPSHPSARTLDIAKSVMAVPLYTAALPLALVVGCHRSMPLLIKIFNHLGKILSYLGIKLVKDAYVTE